MVCRNKKSKEKLGMDGKKTLKTDTTMLQKTNWMRYLIIGISLLILSNSCKKRVGISIQRAIYTYHNSLSDTVRMEIYDGFSKSSSEYVILPSASRSFISEGEGFAFPFNGGNTDSPQGDSIILRFNDRCTTYLYDRINIANRNGSGIYNLTEYDNYSLGLVNQESYELFYSIDSTDYKRSVPCK